jgi:superfamily II DNA or RNA helicase
MPELAPHQQTALVRVNELLNRYGGALLADEVGLGKSFVAAAVAASRQERGCEIELVVPASLVRQWRDTLRSFEVEARMVTHDGLTRDPFVADPAHERLLIVDEAHAFRNPMTQRWGALARRSLAARLLLVTATPICNSLADLAALVRLIAADGALRPHGVHSIDAAFRDREARSLVAIVGALVIRREREVLPASLRFGALASEVIRHPLPDAAIDKLELPLIGEPELVRRFLWRRFESSEEALIESLDRQLVFYDRARDALRTGRVLTKRDYRHAFGEDTSLQGVLFWEVFAPPPLDGDSRALNAAISAEVERISTLRREIAASPRAKLQKLIDLLHIINSPLLIFTGHIATAIAIFDALRRAHRCGLVTARNGCDAIDAFVDGRLDILIATDLAAEGLNLQRAGAVIHYDLPWNPVKVDQRNGRAHRIGQQRPTVRAISFVPEVEKSRASEIVDAKNRVRGVTLRVHPSSLGPSAPAFPQHIPRDAPQATLLRALDRRHLNAPAGIFLRHRAGAERLIAEVARELLDTRRVSDLADILTREVEISSPLAESVIEHSGSAN